MKTTINILILIIVVASGLSQSPVALAAPVAVDITADDTGTSLYLPVMSKGITVDCQFGITIGNLPGNVDIRTLVPKIKAGNFIDWGRVRPAALPVDTQYTAVLYVGDIVDPNQSQSRYNETRLWIETNIANNKGGTWLIGNEPDTVYGNQDGLRAEVYAGRYFTVASRIRELDPTAKIGFGNLVQPSPIRMRYLTKAWNELVRLAGSKEKASSLIDIWSMHAFILNETPGEWGTGVPPGFENDNGDADKIALSNLARTHSITVFEERIRALRQFMVGIGERNKPLWITEYGSLIPPWAPERPTLFVSEEDTAKFMVETFDFLRNAADPDTGYILEKDHLVQRWFWYSLSGRYNEFGGTLFDQKKNYEATYVGRVYMDYISKIPLNSECNP